MIFSSIERIESLSPHVSENMMTLRGGGSSDEIDDEDLETDRYISLCFNTDTPKKRKFVSSGASSFSSVAPVTDAGRQERAAAVKTAKTLQDEDDDAKYLNVYVERGSEIFPNCSVLLKMAPNSEHAIEVTGHNEHFVNVFCRDRFQTRPKRFQDLLRGSTRQPPRIAEKVRKGLAEGKWDGDFHMELRGNDDEIFSCLVSLKPLTDYTGKDRASCVTYGVLKIFSGAGKEEVENIK